MELLIAERAAGRVNEGQTEKFLELYNSSEALFHSFPQSRALKVQFGSQIEDV